MNIRYTFHFSDLIKACAALALMLFYSMLIAGEPAELTMHWAMEPWTSENTSMLEDEIPGVSASLVGFPEDGSEWRLGVLGRALNFDGIDQHVAQNAALPRTAGSLGHWLRTSAADGAQVAVYESDFSGVASPDYNGFGSAGAALEIHTGIFESDFYAIWQDGLERREVRGGTVIADQTSTRFRACRNLFRRF